MFSNEILQIAVDLVSSPYLWLYFSIVVLASYLLIAFFTWSFIKPFKFLATPSIIAGIIFLCLSLSIYVIPISNTIKDIVIQIVKPFLKIGIIFVGMGIGMIIINIILNKIVKKRKSEKVETDESVVKKDKKQELSDEELIESNEKKEDE